MKPVPLIFCLIAIFIGSPARAEEAAWKCAYQLGSGSTADRRKVGTAVVAINVAAKTARIDFGNGWFRKMKLAIDGTDVKETSPPASGSELGFFYFDMVSHSGGFTGDSTDHEFFDACVPTTIEKVADEEPPSLPPNRSVASASKPKPAPLPAVPDKSKAASPPAPEIPDEKTAARAPDANNEPEAASKPSDDAKSASPLSTGPTALEAPRSVIADKPSAVADKKEAPAAPSADGKYQAALKSNNVPHENTPQAQVPEPKATPLPEPEPGTTIYFGDKKVAAKAGPGPDAIDKPEPLAEPAETPAPPPPANPVSPPAAANDKSATTDAAHDQIATLASPPPSVATEHIAACHEALEAATRDAKVNFANASVTFSANSRAALQRIAMSAKNCTSVLVEIGGHTDNLGNAAQNKVLSMRRAQSVVDFLVKAGVDPANLKAVGYGQEQPIASNTTAAGRQLNRRVEFRLSATPAQAGSAGAP